MMLFAQLLLAALPLVLGQDSSYGYIPPDWIMTTNPPTPMTDGTPWGSKNANNTNTYVDPPNTGVVRTFDLTIARASISPDGYNRNGIIINGGFPGPLIEANWGDTIQVTVHNQITNPPEGTSIHWHGMLQKNTQFMDGVCGITQCPLAPGKTFTYTFKADLYGTTWYHSHLSAQYADGVVGPMIIHGPTTVKYDIDVGPVFLNDWYHTSYQNIVKAVTGPNIMDLIAGVTSDSNLIQGRNSFDCSSLPADDDTTCVSNSSLATFQLQPGKVHRIRLINAGAEGIQKFTIDNHIMTVIANDFVPILPYTTKVVTLGVGQRTDILITGIANEGRSGPDMPGVYYIRSSIASAPCSFSHAPDAKAMIYYTHSKLGNPVKSQPYPEWTASLGVCTNDPLSMTQPWYTYPAAVTPDKTQPMVIDFGFNVAQGGFRFTVNGDTWKPNDTSPVLQQAIMGQTTFPDGSQTNVYNTGTASTYRMILTNAGPLAHPMHLHGHNFQVLAVGVGTWDGVITNQKNPQRRDVQILPMGGYLVLQIDTDNPGVWKLHCHIDWHLAEGLSMSIIEQPGKLVGLPVPANAAQQCADWKAFSLLPEAHGCPYNDGQNITTSNRSVFNLACSSSFDGNELGSTSVKSLEECLEFCTITKGCISVNWASNINPATSKQTCWAMSGKNARSQGGQFAALLVGTPALAGTTTSSNTKTTSTTTKATTTPTTLAKNILTTSTTPTATSPTSTAKVVATVPGAGTVAMATPVNCPGDDNKTNIRTSSGSTFKLTCATTYSGKNLDFTKTSTFEACLQLCSTTTGCVSVVWSGDTNPAPSPESCWVKDGTTGTAQRGVMGGLLTTPKTNKRHVAPHRRLHEE